MLSLNLNHSPQQKLSILCLGAHSDDIEIGCGGALLRLVQDYPQADVHWIVASAVGPRETEASESAARFRQHGIALDLRVETFRDGYFPYEGAAIKDYFESQKAELNPDLIFTHYGSDAHQDHRFISDLTWNTWRNHTILEYEIPKYDGDLGQPNLFIPLETHLAEIKVSHLMDVFATQQGRDWFSRDLFWSLLRIRGMEARSPSGFAEAFHCRKLSLLP